MAKAAGRLAQVLKNAVVIGGVRVSNFKANATPIDVTDNDSLGLIEVLADYADKQISFEVSGVAKDAVLRTIAFSPTASHLIEDMTFKFADALTGAETIAGDFFMTDYEEGNDYKEATTFSASFTSSGAWTVA